MQRWKNISFNIILFLNGLLLFLLIFESRLSLPVWLQVVGRMHPLLLHFPVVLVILYALTSVLLPSRKTGDTDTYRNITDTLLLLAALSAALTALMGLFLSLEAGYDKDVLQWHKWSGVGISFFTLGWYYFRRPLQAKIAGLLTAAVALCLIIFTGHQGAGITHGQNFLLAPMMPEKEKAPVTLEEAEVYANMVKPILEAKCMSCHNEKKAKGELIMETEAQLLKGGKNGILWDSTAPDLGLLLHRVHLPLEEKKHMPPQGKVQLTDDEIAIITQWIRKGSDFKLRVIGLPATDTLRQLAQVIFTAAETASYDFDAADPAEIKKLNTINRVVTEEALNSPALSVNFFNSQLFKPEQLKELSGVKKQVVSLDLAKMPVTDADLSSIAELENLRRLNLSFTNITGDKLSLLKALKSLQTISLAGTKVNAAALRQLQDFPQLKTVYTWNIPVSGTELEQIKEKAGHISFLNGFRGDTMVLKLSPPVIQNEELIITGPVPLKLKHYIAGTSIRYTLDGTEPDSLLSPEFKGTETINGNVLVRARAYKPGWTSSELAEVSFYKNTFTPDTVIFLTQPEPGYKADSKILIDQLKGETAFRNGNWLAWRQSKMELLLPFAKPSMISSITLGSLVDAGSYIMPPSLMEVWGGNEPGKLRLLGKLTPPQPTSISAAILRGFECKFPAVTVSYIKIIATPVYKLPAWHPGKGDKAWLFTDEILVN